MAGTVNAIDSICVSARELDSTVVCMDVGIFISDVDDWIMFDDEERLFQFPIVVMGCGYIS